MFVTCFLSLLQPKAGSWIYGCDHSYVLQSVCWVSLPRVIHVLRHVSVVAKKAERTKCVLLEQVAGLDVKSASSDQPGKVIFLPVNKIWLLDMLLLKSGHVVELLPIVAPLPHMQTPSSVQQRPSPHHM
jgi:hypothetical protein